MNQNVNPNAHNDCVRLIKTGQAKDPEWKDAWHLHCGEHGGGTNDPGKHDSLFLLAFCFKYGISRLVNAAWAKDFLESLGEVAKPHLVRALKRGQAMNNEWRQKWIEFTDAKNENPARDAMRDPNRQAAGTLMEFYDSIAVPLFADEEWMQPILVGSYSGGGPGPAEGGEVIGIGEEVGF